MEAPSPAKTQYQLTYENESKAAGIIASDVICLSAAWIAVSLRLISRRLNQNQLKADDWWALLALCFNTGGITNNLLLVRFGLGRHAVVVEDPAVYAKLFIAGEALYPPCLVTFKFSVLCLYYRLFPGRRFRFVLWSLGAFTLAYSVALLLSSVLQCIPLRALYDPHTSGKCVKLVPAFTICGIFNTMTDIVMLGLPLPQLWKLQIKTVQKLQLTGMFLLGGFVCVVSIIRIPQFRSASFQDPSWSDVPGITWSIVECNIGLVSACLPTLRPLYSYVFRHSTTHNAGDIISTEGRNLRSRESHNVPLREYEPKPSSNLAHPFTYLEDSPGIRQFELDRSA